MSAADFMKVFSMGVLVACLFVGDTPPKMTEAVLIGIVVLPAMVLDYIENRKLEQEDKIRPYDYEQDGI